MLVKIFQDLRKKSKNLKHHNCSLQISKYKKYVPSEKQLVEKIKWVITQNNWFEFFEMYYAPDWALCKQNRIDPEKDKFLVLKIEKQCAVRYF